MQIYEEAESNANAFAFACLFSPSETGDLGLTDTTGETGDASLTACMAEAQQYFCRRQTSQSREQDDLTVVFVIHYLINCYDNPTKNHCSERDPPRPHSEHKFYGIFFLINMLLFTYTEDSVVPFPCLHRLERPGVRQIRPTATSQMQFTRIRIMGGGNFAENQKKF